MQNNLTVKNIRAINKLNVLSTIAYSDGITRFDIAQNNNLSLMTITNVVDELLDCGYIYEVKSTASIGRTPSKLYLNVDNGIIVCCDINSKLLADYTIFDLRKKMIYTSTFTFDKDSGYAKNRDKLFSAIKDSLSELDGTLIGLGLCIQGVYDSDEDVIKTSIIGDAENGNFKNLISCYFNCDNVFISHDINMAAKAELEMIGDENTMFYMFVGREIGGTFINRGVILKGVNQLAGDVGQLMCHFNGKDLQLEAIASIPAILNALAQYDTIDDVVDNYAKDATVKGYLDKIAALVSTTIYNITWLFNPSHFVIGSNSVKFADFIATKAMGYQEAKKIENKSVETGFNAVTTKVVASSINGNASLLGLWQEVVDRYLINCINN